MKFALPILVGVLLLSTNVRADDDGSYVNYENLVNELKASADEKPPAPVDPRDDYGWEDVAVHGNVALATSYASITAPSGVNGTGLMTGVTVGFGINLFSKHVRAEGAFSSFEQASFDSAMKVDLKEFEMRLIYLPSLRDNVNLRLGTGLAARYMSIDTQNGGVWSNYQANTPSALLLVGCEYKLGKSVAIGPDLSYRSAMITDTFDRSAWDAAIRLNATF